MNEEMMKSWQAIDGGLLSLMAKNDELADDELRAKGRRLRHLAKFTETLAKRIDERLRENVNPGSIGELFD